MKDRGHLLTEVRNPRSLRIDRMSVHEVFDWMHDGHVAGIVEVEKGCIT